MVRVRSGEHTDYSRLVFDWDKKVPYTLAREGANLVITFKDPESLDLSEVSTGKLAAINALGLLSGGTGETRLSVTTAPDAPYKDFYLGTKIVLDILKSASPPAKEPPAKVKPEPEPKKAEQKQKEPERKAPPRSAPEKTPDSHSHTHLHPHPHPHAEKHVHNADHDAALAALSSDLKEPHVVSVSATQAGGLAVFLRGGYMWLVSDKADLPVPPQIGGPSPKLFGEIRELEIDGGKAYRLKIPQGGHVYGEGGGLVWRAVVSPSSRGREPSRFERRVTVDDVRGGAVSIHMPGAREVLELQDTLYGDRVYIITVTDSSDLGGMARDFVDMEILESPIGLAVRPKTDDLSLRIEGENVVITRPEGLAISKAADKAERALGGPSRKFASDRHDHDHTSENEGHLFHFKEWQLGGPERMEENRRVLMSSLGLKNEQAQIEDTLILGKMYLAAGWGAEALGYLRVAAQKLPDIERSPEYMALYGVASAVAGKNEQALKYLITPALDDYSEIGYWRSAVLGRLGDWQQAAKYLPDSVYMLTEYPPEIRTDLALILAEVALRAARPVKAEGLLRLVSKSLKGLKPHQKAELDYLDGQVARQNGETEKALRLWKPLADGEDPLFRAKAGLAMTRLMKEDGTLNHREAIDRLEALRYVWRGDELETQINYRLGEMYLEDGQYAKGLTIMREAAALSPETELGKMIASKMTDTYVDLFLSDQYEHVSPLDALTVYEEFKELTPPGSEADEIVAALAEKMAENNLLGRAADLLKYQTEHRLSGLERQRTLVRLSAIYLLDGQDVSALEAIDDALKSAPKPTPEKRKEMLLLKARTLSGIDRTDEALDLLNAMDLDPRVNRLRADLAWHAENWQEAADALQDLLFDESISRIRPLKPEQAQLILNRAVALNLAQDRVGLANIRERYGALMEGTEKARLFEVVTRPRQAAVLSDRKTIEALTAEVDMFGEFLENYRNKDPLTGE